MFRDSRTLFHIEQFFGQGFAFWMGDHVVPMTEPGGDFAADQAHVDVQLYEGEWTFGLYWPHDPVQNPDFCGYLLSAVHECAHLFPFYALWEDGDPEVLFNATPTQHERYAAFVELLFADQFRNSFPLLASRVLTRFGPNGHPGEVVYDAHVAWRRGFNLRSGGVPLLGVALPLAGR